jgi:YebC/PmpR family DNA-binding regulatory protein
MAGHSKWANIKHRKAAQDARRGKLYTRLIREVTIAARGGGNPADNPRLRLAMDKALGANMPKDTIERAIARGTGELGGTHVEEITYEGYAPGGVAVLVEAITDNRNRTVAEVRHAFGKYGGNLGAGGSVGYLFKKRGVITFTPGAPEDRLLELALDAGADDLETEDDGAIAVLTAPDAFSQVLDALTKAGLTPDHSEVTMLAANSVTLNAEAATRLTELIDALEELDDVQNVHHNAAFPDDDVGG